MRRTITSILIFILALAFPAMVCAWPMPDTGQATCYNDVGNVIPCPQPGEPFYGQDAQYAGPNRSYTKLGQNGVSLPDTTTQTDDWLMTRDNVTGLIWEIKTDDVTIHDKDNTYTWYDSTEDFINALNAENFGGFSDWRMPTVKELSSLVNSGTYYPTIDNTWFPHTMSTLYWSSTTIVGYTDRAGLVSFYSGYVYGNNKSLSYYVRAVRAGQSGSLGDLVDNGDGTVTDPNTDLMWQQATAPGTYTWEDALSYCETLSLGGFSDWRLPNRNELQTLVDYSRYDPAIDPIMASGTMSFYYWSSTTSAYNTNYSWLVYFSYGDVSNTKKSSSYYVRAVRAGQVGSLAIEATAGDHGTIDPAGSVTVEYGSSQSFTITPETGCHVADVLVDGVSVGAVSAYTFENVTAGHTIRANFEENIPGDIDDDKKVEIDDAIIALRIIAGIGPGQPVELSADVNGDGNVGIEEVFYILQYLSEVYH